MKEISVETLFEQPPPHWGLRGDPYFWQELKETFTKDGLPLGEDAFLQRLYHYFEMLVGQKAERSGEWIFVKKYDVGGLSRGMVSPDFWIDKGFPFLLQRFAEKGGTVNGGQ